MKNVLVLKSSILADHSTSNKLVDFFKTQITANITERDFGVNPLPYYDGTAAFAARNEPQTEEQKVSKALTDELVAELNAHDVLVFGVPMYNLGVPAQLKTYIDYLNVVGTTFRYTENGPEGLIKGKKAIVVLAHGGIYKDGPADLAKLYMQTVLNFIGISDVEFVYAEGIGYGPDVAEKAVEAAKEELVRLAKAL